MIIFSFGHDNAIPIARLLPHVIVHRSGSFFAVLKMKINLFGKGSLKFKLVRKPCLARALEGRLSKEDYSPFASPNRGLQCTLANVALTYLVRVLRVLITTRLVTNILYSTCVAVVFHFKHSQSYLNEIKFQETFRSFIFVNYPFLLTIDVLNFFFFLYAIEFHFIS